MAKQLEFYFPKSKSKHMSSPKQGKAYPSKGGTIRWGLQAIRDGGKSLPKFVTKEMYESYGFSVKNSETVGHPTPANPLEEVPAILPSPAEPTNESFNAEMEDLTDGVSAITNRFGDSVGIVQVDDSDDDIEDVEVQIIDDDMEIVYEDTLGAESNQKEAHIASLEMWEDVLKDNPNDEEAQEQYNYWYEVVHGGRETPHNPDYEAESFHYGDIVCPSCGSDNWGEQEGYSCRDCDHVFNPYNAESFDAETEIDGGEYTVCDPCGDLETDADYVCADCEDDICFNHMKLWPQPNKYDFGEHKPLHLCLDCYKHNWDIFLETNKQPLSLLNAETYGAESFNAAYTKAYQIQMGDRFSCGCNIGDAEQPSSDTWGNIYAHCATCGVPREIYPANHHKNAETFEAQPDFNEETQEYEGTIKEIYKDPKTNELRVKGRWYYPQRGEWIEYNHKGCQFEGCSQMNSPEWYDEDYCTTACANDMTICGKNKPYSYDLKSVSDSLAGQMRTNDSWNDGAYGDFCQSLTEDVEGMEMCNDCDYQQVDYGAESFSADGELSWHTCKMCGDMIDHPLDIKKGLCYWHQPENKGLAELTDEEWDERFHKSAESFSAEGILCNGCPEAGRNVVIRKDHTDEGGDLMCPFCHSNKNFKNIPVTTYLLHGGRKEDLMDAESFNAESDIPKKVIDDSWKVARGNAPIHASYWWDWSGKDGGLNKKRFKEGFTDGWNKAREKVKGKMRWELVKEKRDWDLTDYDVSYYGDGYNYTEGMKIGFKESWKALDDEPIAPYEFINYYINGRTGTESYDSDVTFEEVWAKGPIKVVVQKTHGKSELLDDFKQVYVVNENYKNYYVDSIPKGYGGLYRKLEDRINDAIEIAETFDAETFGAERECMICRHYGDNKDFCKGCGNCGASDCCRCVGSSDWEEMQREFPDVPYGAESFNAEDDNYNADGTNTKVIIGVAGLAVVLGLWKGKEIITFIDKIKNAMK